MTDPTLIAGRYRLDVPLASGGMGVVWRGWDERLERAVAVKQIRLQPGLGPAETAAVNDRAMREARITARLHHPAAVPIYDVVEHDGQPCLIMQFVPSVSLQATLRSCTTLPTVEVAGIGSELAAALSAAHRTGIVHRDVKPGNVLLTEDGSAKLTDFGISHAMGDINLTSTGMVTGTPAYLAPEVARGQSATFASDVFSLGSTLYTATEGHPPFGADDNPMAVLHRAASGQVIPPRRSGQLTPLLLRMLNPDPALRPSMQEASAALTSLHRDLLAMGASTAAPELNTAHLTRPNVLPAQAAEPPARTATASPTGDRSDSRFRGALLLFAALGAVAAVAIGLVYVLPRIGDHSGSAGVVAPGSTTRARTTTASTARPRSTSKAATVSASPTPSIPPSTRSQPTTTTSRSTSTTATATATATATTAPVVRTKTSPTTPSTSAQRPAVGSTKDQLAQALIDYYSLMPGNLDAGWSKLTSAYQSGHAGGFSGYQRFWANYRSVSASNVVGLSSDSAQATITYRDNSGATVVERTQYRFVRNGGRLLISDSSVLSRSG